jgi:peptide deformylase
VSLLDIRVLGDPILRRDTTIVPAVTDDIRRLADDMFETMYAAKGIGLAAPQVGRLERVTVVDVDGARFVLVNPEIVHSEGSTKGEEGCLSIPDIYADVERFGTVKVRAIGLDGEPFELTGTELLGRCLQHEIDHLHGRLFIDKLSMLKKRSTMQKWEKLKSTYPGFIRKVVPGEFDDDREDTL